jgi:methionyl-tRNA synthetase
MENIPGATPSSEAAPQAASPAAPQPAAPVPAVPVSPTVTIEDFKKFAFRVGEIKEVKDHPNADKLYVLTIDLGGRTKQLVAGIKPSYQKEELVGKQVVVVDNLQPAMLRGVESQGMVLAASDDAGIAVVSPLRAVKLGSTVK